MAREGGVALVPDLFKVRAQGEKILLGVWCQQRGKVRPFGQPGGLGWVESGADVFECLKVEGVLFGFTPEKLLLRQRETQETGKPAGRDEGRGDRLLEAFGSGGPAQGK